MAHKRFGEINVVRGVAVFLMVLAHTIAIYGSQSVVFLEVLRQFGDVVCFTLFLFSFGSGVYLSFFAREVKSLGLKVAKRSIYLFAAYYVIAFLSLLSEPKSIEKTIHTAFLLYTPTLTEFLIPFIIYTLCIPLLIRYKNAIFSLKDNNALVKVLLLGIFSYIFGTLIYHLSNGLNVPFVVKSYLALMSGSPDMARFPIFQYFPIMLLGMYYGYVRSKQKQFLDVLTERKIVMAISVLIVSGIVLLNVNTLLELNSYQRFPPSIVFLLFGLIVTGTVLFAAFSKSTRISNNFFSTVGRHALGVLVFHISIIKLLQYRTIVTVDSPITMAVMFCFLLTGYLGLYFVYSRYSASILRYGKIFKL